MTEDENLSFPIKPNTRKLNCNKMFIFSVMYKVVLPKVKVWASKSPMLGVKLSLISVFVGRKFDFKYFVFVFVAMLIVIYSF